MSAPRTIAAALLLIVCLGGLGHPALAARQTIEIRGGQSATVTDRDGHALLIHFVRVVSDERCPAKVMCAWARPPVVTLDLTDPARHTVTLTATVTSDPAKAVRFNGWSIRADQLAPIPQVPAEFAKLKPLADYTVILEIDHLDD